MLRIKSEMLRRRRHEISSMMSRSDRSRKLIELLSILFLLAAANVVGMMYFESLNLSDAVWLTMTTITTVGYGDYVAQTVGGRLTTIVSLYIFGIFLLAQIAGEWIDLRLDRKERMRKGLWSWDMKNHILIINTPDTDGDRYLHVLVEQIRHSKSLADHSIQVFSGNYPDGLPDDLVKLGVVLHQGAPEGRGQLSEVNIESATFIIVLSVDSTDYRSDSITLDILDRMKEYQLTGYVIVECIQDENRGRLRQHGADAVIRPVRAYPELMVRAMAAPGTETILEDLFKHEGVHSRRYDVNIPSQPWGTLASRLMLEGLGTPLGYIDREGKIITNPVASEKVTGSVLFMMVSHDRIAVAAKVQLVVDNI
tara:strand:- start:2823 stop:3923 length:1101 start_codon:yes stop_codon:yes gene_type:complete